MDNSPGLKSYDILGFFHQKYINTFCVMHDFFQGGSCASVSSASYCCLILVACNIILMLRFS